MSLKLWSWKASEIVDSLASGEISQLDVLNSLEERYFEVNPVINALPTVCFEKARAYLESEDRALRKKRPLMGLPVPVKDSYAVSGVRTTFGSLCFENWVPDRSDRVVTTLEKSGAVIFAKSNTPEFEAGASTFNEVFGITRNPWNLKRSVAGSSGGAAAAVASGMAFIAQGSDFACSIRYPAAFCGIIGLRPTPGLIPQGPNRLPYQNLSVIGPLARNVEDIGLAMDAMVAFDALDPLTSPTFAQEYRLAAKSARKPKNIGFSIANSPLFKTAMAGEDPNWGRIVMAIGKSKENIIANKIQIKFGNFLVAEQSRTAKDYNESDVKEYMKWDSINIEVNLNIGAAAFTVYTCDFTHDYIDINADYRN